MWLNRLALAIWAVTAPIHAVMWVTLVLVLADFSTGIWAAYRRQEKIDSHGFRRTIVKLFVYQAAIMLAWLVQAYLTGDAVPALKVTTSLIGLTELKSLLENLDAINGGSMFKGLAQKLVGPSVDKQSQDQTRDE